MKKTSIIWGVLFICGSAVSVYAVGSRGLGNQSVGSYSIGQANAVTARSEDVSANFFNPAGLAYLEGGQVSVGGQVMTPIFSYDSGTAKEDAAKNVFFIPNFFAGGAIGQTGLAWGIGMTSPFGLCTDWSETGNLRYLATRSQLVTYHVNPNVAFKIHDKVSIAAGADYMHATVDMKKQVDTNLVGNGILQGLFQLPQLPSIVSGQPDATSQLEADGGGWGYNVGLLVQPFEGHHLGVSYKSAIDVKLKGDAKLTNMSGLMGGLFGGSSYSTKGESTMRFPDAITVGYALDLTDVWTVETDFEWTGWYRFREQNVIYTEETHPGRLGILNGGNPKPRKWNDVASAAIGTQYKVGESVVMRGGYLFQDSPVPDETFEPAIPDSDMHGVSIGSGFEFKGITLDIAYMACIFEKRIVKNNVGSEIGTSINGKYSTFSNSFALNLSYSF